MQRRVHTEHMQQRALGQAVEFRVARDGFELSLGMLTLWTVFKAAPLELAGVMQG